MKLYDILSDFGSSNIDAISYYPDRQVFEVRFLNKTVYQYEGVPIALWKKLKKASSKGKFFHKHIRNNFKAIKLGEAVVENYMTMNPVVPVQTLIQPQYYRKFELDLMNDMKRGKKLDFEALEYNDKIRVENLIQRSLITDRYTLTSKGHEYLDQMEKQSNAVYTIPFYNVSLR